MATLSHEALRRAIYRHGGCDEYYTEMINAASLVNGGKFEKYYILNGPEPEKIVWQLTGDDAGKLAEAAAIVREKGGLGIDINMGCSAPEIYKHGAGIAWMMKPAEETREMLRAVRAAVGNLRFSAKIRLGDEDFTENSFFSFVDMLLEEGISRIVLHPRTRKEKYSRPARWVYIQKLIDHVEKIGGHPASQSEKIGESTGETSSAQNPESAQHISIVGNGCVSDIKSFNALCKAAPQMDGIMIGRAAVQKPWIFAELSSYEASNIKFIKFFNSNLSNFEKRVYPIDMYKEAELFTADLIEYQPEEFYETRSKRFFTFFLDNFMYAHYLRSKILNTSVREEQLSYLREYFEKMPEERFYNLGEN